MKRTLLALVLGLVLGSLTPVAGQSGPFASQIQSALNSLLAGNVAFTVIANTPTVVVSLPTCNAAAKGQRAFVTDSNAALTAGIGAVIAGGGANNVPVVCDGTNWRIG